MTDDETDGKVASDLGGIILEGGEHRESDLTWVLALEAT